MDTRQEPTETVMNPSLLGSTLTTSQQDGDYKDSLNELPFFRQQTHMNEITTHMNEITQECN